MYKSFIVQGLTILLSVLIWRQSCAQSRYENQMYTSVSTANEIYGQNLKYDGSNQSLSMDIYTGAGDLAKNRACVVFCFGGAFVQGNRASAEIVYLASFLAQYGYVCISIDYRLDQANNMQIGNNELKAPIRAVQDAKAAIRYIKSRHIELGIDTNSIFIGGTSAGGVIAMTLGYSQYNDFIPNVRSVIDSVGGYEGQSNFLPNTSNVKGLFNFSGGIFDTSHIGSKDLPIYLNHSTMDATVPFYSGLPLNGQSKNLLHGSGNIYRAMILRGGYAVIDSFKNAFHPSFASNNPFTDMYNTFISLNNFLKLQIKSTSSIQHRFMNSEAFIYPNPAREKLYIEANDLLYTHEPYEIYDTEGRLLKASKLTSNEVNISDLIPGMYRIVFQKANQVFIKE